MPIASGTFQPEWSSLMQYRCPAWFRDAKFGIWAHWSPQCVPEQGDWYARSMYEQGSADYNYHVATYGHPSKFGYKDLCHLWTAAKWDPDRLIQLYKRAGAQYFVALANHHCNFDAWDSTYQPWNSVNVGPHKDIVGLWAKTARKHGLRFGVTVHSARAWDWFDVSHGSDKTGPLAGVPYDGNLTKADGKGQWWEGLDPQDLYCRPHKPGEPPDQAYVVKWFSRTRDLVDKYHPDLLYFDDGGLPLGEAGLRIAAHYYNANTRWHQGKLDAVLTTKGLPPEQRKAVTLDIERGLSDRIEPYPWQTDTCIGEWHYHRGIHYKTAAQVIPMLADIVSKNGNLLLNIPVRGDGTIDDEETAFLEDMAAWMKVNSEAIFATRPWIVSGEGGRAARGGSFNEGGFGGMTAKDFRFTLKGNTLYALALGWPEDGRLVVRSLAKSQGFDGQVTGVSLLGYKGKVQWRRDDEGLKVKLPAAKPCTHVYVLKLVCINPTHFNPELAASPPALVSADAQGNYVLDTSTAQLHGEQVQFENRAGTENVGFWDRPGDWVSWRVSLAEAGSFDVTAMCAAAAGPSEFVLEVAGQKLEVRVPAGSDWDTYAPVKCGTLTIDKPGQYEVSIRPRDSVTWRAINMTAIRMTRLRP